MNLGVLWPSFALALILSDLVLQSCVMRRCDPSRISPRIQCLTRRISNLFAGSLPTLSPVQKESASSFPGSRFALNKNETWVWLVSVPLNRVELPLAGFCFAFLREVDSMAFGVRGVQNVRPSFFRGAIAASNFASFCHIGHQNGHYAYIDRVSY